MQGEFNTSYKRLNPAQKQAVDYIDGPLLVLAGPGTGKTELLSLRVANILKLTDTDATNIICLTFTNSAANNMQERLFKLIGPSAYSVSVKTFHSFAAEIMQSYPEYFWNGARLSIVPDALQLEVITKILDKLPLASPLAVKFQGRYTSLRDIKEALKLAKEAGLTPAKLKAMIKANIAYIDEIEADLADILSAKLSVKNLDSLRRSVEKLPDQNISSSILPLRSLSDTIKESLEKAISLDEDSGKLKNVSKWKSNWLQNVNSKPGLYAERRRNTWWLNLADLYEKYRDQLHGLGYYDYSDMIVEVITQLEQNSELLALVQERYEYVLIDEFQDTNAAQFRMAHLVANHYSAEGKPNIMAVGDDDQTIYAFNGAELNNMLSFIDSYEGTKIIALNTNYRSNQDILNFSEKLISLSDSRIVNSLERVDKSQLAIKTKQLSKLAHLSYPTREHQLAGVAHKIKQNQIDYPNHTIAVLARSHESLVKLSAILLKKDVNVSYEKQNNVLDNDLIKEIILIVKVIEAIGNGREQVLNVNLAKLLSQPTWHISPATYFNISLRSYKQRKNWLEVMKSFVDSNLDDYYKWLLWLARTAKHENLNVMMEYILGLKASKYLTSPLNSHYLTAKKMDSLRIENLSALNVLLNQVSNYAAGKNEKTGIFDLLSFIDINQQANQQIVDQSWFSTSEKSVQLMSVHKAKGLEFDRVYLIDAIDREWKPKNKRLSSPANLPLKPYGEDFNDYIRLAYVAATRSKLSFISSSYKFSDSGEQLIQSPLFSALPQTSEASNDASLANNQALLENNISWPILFTSNVKELARPLLKDYQLSSTALNNYLDIINNGPEEFYLNHIFRIPQPTTVHMAFGVAVHSALEAAQQQINNGSYSLNRVIEVFRETLARQAITSDEYNKYLDRGSLILKNLLKRKHTLFSKSGLPEVSLSGHKLEAGAEITGKLDNIVKEGDSLLITDFKTGKPLKDFNSKAATSLEKVWRQKNQLLFYTLLVKSSPQYKSIKTIKTRIIYVEAGHDDELILDYEPEPEELVELTKVITAVYKNIVSYKQVNTLDYPKTIEGINLFTKDLLKA